MYLLDIFMLTQTNKNCIIIFMTISAKKTFKKLEWTIERERKGLWCSENLLTHFKKACEHEGLDYSPVLQDLLEQVNQFKKKPSFIFQDFGKRKRASHYCSGKIRSAFFEKCNMWRLGSSDVIEWAMNEYIEQIEDKHGVEIK